MSAYSARRIALVLVCTFAPHQAAAQIVFPGTRVRVVSIERRTTVITGELMRLAGDSITVRTAANRTVSLAAAEHFLDVSAGVGRRTWTGAALGSVVGLVAGLAVGGTTHPPCGSMSSICMSQGEETMFNALALAIPGALVGGIIGHFIKRERWREVELPPPVRMTIAPAARRGVMLTATVAF